MNKTSDIRNRKLSIKVRQDESCLDAIARYMKRNGYTVDRWTDGKGIPHLYFNNGSFDLWVSGYTLNDNTCKFSLSGDAL